MLEWEKPISSLELSPERAGFIFTVRASGVHSLGDLGQIPSAALRINAESSTKGRTSLSFCKDLPELGGKIGAILQVPLI